MLPHDFKNEFCESLIQNWGVYSGFDTGIRTKLLRDCILSAVKQHAQFPSTVSINRKSGNMPFTSFSPSSKITETYFFLSII